MERREVLKIHKSAKADGQFCLFATGAQKKVDRNNARSLSCSQEDVKRPFSGKVEQVPLGSTMDKSKPIVQMPVLTTFGSKYIVNRKSGSRIKQAVPPPCKPIRYFRINEKRFSVVGDKSTEQVEHGGCEISSTCEAQESEKDNSQQVRQPYDSHTTRLQNQHGGLAKQTQMESAPRMKPCQTGILRNSAIQNSQDDHTNSSLEASDFASDEAINKSIRKCQQWLDEYCD